MLLAWSNFPLQGATTARYAVPMGSTEAYKACKYLPTNLCASRLFSDKKALLSPKHALAPDPSQSQCMTAVVPASSGQESDPIVDAHNANGRIGRSSVQGVQTNRPYFLTTLQL